MFRPPAVSAIVTIFCLVGISCQAVTGDVDVIPAPLAPMPMPGPAMAGDAPTPSSNGENAPLPSQGPIAEAPAAEVPLDEGLPPATDGSGSLADAASAVDAAPPFPAPRPVLVAAATALERVGAVGGEPHLGVCAGGVVIGVRPTANPGEDVFGQRLTLIEPICGSLILDPGDGGNGPRVSVVADETLLMWPQTDELQGPPVREVPDPRLVWVIQPPTLCPEATPVMVGVVGEYDPSIDGTATAVIRSVAIECSALVVGPDGIAVGASALGRQRIARADSFAGDGLAEYASSCADGTVTTQILVHAGFWLDGFVLGCSNLSAPLLAGDACADGAQCESGVCGLDATCEP